MQQRRADDESEIINYSYDGKGRLIKRETEGKDKDENPVVAVTTYDYENDLYVLSEKHVRNGNTYTYYVDTYEREYDALGNIVCLRYYEHWAYQEEALKWISEWEYDEGGKLLSSKYMEGHRADSDSEVYYENYVITQYNASGDIFETSTRIGIS